MNPIIGTAALFVFAALAFVAGYGVGVRDTEKRWSDAVNRAEDSRKRSQL